MIHCLNTDGVRRRDDHAHHATGCEVDRQWVRGNGEGAGGMGSGVGGRFYHTPMLLCDGENLCFFACDVYVLKLICFKNSMYCDLLRYVAFTC
jgi:hypothetical protein